MSFISYFCGMIKRFLEVQLIEILGNFPCLALVGPRQCGKTTLARKLAESFHEALYLDLESSRDLVKLEDAEAYLEQFADRLVIIDEVQRKKELFPLLRSLIDRKRTPGRFLLLGSASPDLIRDTSESLAGRVVYKELTPFLFNELYPEIPTFDQWVYGGFPDAILRKSAWITWMGSYIRTYLERDLPLLGYPGNANVTGRLLSMLAHYHANLVNINEISKSLGLTAPTVKRYLDFLEQAFLIRILYPYYSNLGKRLIKTPRIFIRDSGILHYTLGLNSYEELIGHPKCGASWEGFVIEQILAILPDSLRCFFYRTHDGAELDLVICKGDVPIYGIEIKMGSELGPGRGNTEAFKVLQTQKNFLIHQGEEEFYHSSGLLICGLTSFLTNHIEPLIEN